MKNPFGAINAIDNALAFARAGRLLDQTAIDQLASVREEINQEFPHDEDGKPISRVKDEYEGGLCPDCQEPIPADAIHGGECSNCGHVWTEPSETDDEKVHKMTADEFALLNVPISEHTDIFLAFTSGKNYFDLDPASSDLDVDLDESLIDKLEEIGAALTPRNVASGDLEINMPKREISIHAKTLHT